MEIKLKKLGLIFGIAGSMFLYSCGGGESAEETTEEATEEAVAEEMTDDTEEASDGWETFTPDGGGFSIDMPGSPIYSSQIVPTEIGNLTMHMYTIEKSSTEAVMIAYADYPEALIPDVQAEEDLERTVAEAGIAGIGGTVESSEYVEIDGGRRAFLAKGVAPYQGYSIHLSYKVFFVKNRLFQLMWMKDAMYPDQGDLDRFYSTLKVLSDDDGAEEVEEEAAEEAAE